ncbi:hypothetical protein BT96DRAFT_1016746 [Gymnopus androsaceus JB14]|uniref:F-box domain-containing protein n=1 Tax=Gymnopus androsaceus JB14 TaxID=1447944 RepID=A0A6A4I577_9AGAR|nr:hypothetical protein BT96DRAFT_1016746 [Gymnopus androsaceus JB14]
MAHPSLDHGLAIHQTPVSGTIACIFPSLESLQLETAKIRKDTRLQSLTNAPKLLYFSCPQNITTLTIVGISQNLESYYAILRSCPQLSSCTISLPDDFTDFLETSPEIIKLAHLEELDVEFIGHFGCPDFFDILDLPNLIDLSIRHLPSDDDRSDFSDPFPYLSALFERSDNFPEVPSLACLSLVHCSLDDSNVLSHIDPWFDEDPEETGIDNASISDLACSRWRQEKKHESEDNAENSAGGEPGNHGGVERLEFLRVSEELLGGEGENSDRARLEALQQQGMEVVIE